MESKREETVTVTWCECGENNPGMQRLGKRAKVGYDQNALSQAKAKWEAQGFECELIALHDYLPAQHRSARVQAWLLIARRGVEAFVDSKVLLDELRVLPWDKKAFMKGTVKNKRARHNLCFADTAQEPDYERKRGRVVPFSSTPQLAKVRAGLGELLGSAGQTLLAEGNYYYDTKQCYIGWHGDTERRKVVGVRLGASMPLAFHWYLHSERVGTLYQVNLNHGDVYMMSEKAVGTDWRQKKIPTLRHAAGDKGIVLKVGCSRDADCCLLYGGVLEQRQQEALPRHGRDPRSHNKCEACSRP
jgi:alkylated DNA repair dioxygenase AlkB